MDITNKLLKESSPLINLLGKRDYAKNHIGYVYEMSFTEAFVLTNDVKLSKT